MSGAGNQSIYMKIYKDLRLKHQEVRPYCSISDIHVWTEDMGSAGQILYEKFMKQKY